MFCGICGVGRVVGKVFGVEAALMVLALGMSVSVSVTMAVPRMAETLMNKSVQ